MRKFIKLGLILMSSVLLAGCANQEVQEQKIPIYSFEEENPAPIILENDNLKFTFDPATTYFQVLDKANNTVWDSNPTGAATDPKADAQSLKNLQSTIVLSYMDDTGIETLYNNFDKSISKLAYQISQQGDSIQVDYTLGDIQKTYYIPLAAPLSRMQVFLDKMDSTGKRQVNRYYRKIDINKLLPDDNKDELLKQYPDLANEPVYVLRDGIQDYLKEDIQTIFAGVGYTEQDYKDDLARYSQTTSTDKPYFNVSVIYRLEGKDLVVELPYDKMEYKPAFQITKIQVLPYFGAGTTTDNGFIMVPEGTGAIINFNNGKNEQNPYYSQVYGWDYGESRESSTDENSSTFPIFGISKNGSSMLCMLENYASVAAIEADVSGRTHSYNWAAAKYTTLHESALKVSAKTDKSVIVFEDKKPTGSITQRYRFLETDSYSKMAEAYRGYLMDKHPELVKKDETSTPVNVTMVGAIDEVKQRFGLPVSVPIALTTYKDAYDILGDLKQTGYDNLSVKYRGWMNGGLKQTALNSVKTISELGSEGKLKSFLDYGKELGVPIYLDGAVENIFNKGMFDGFIVNRDAAKYASREIVKLYDFSPVYYGIEDWYDPYYFVKTQKAISYMQTLADYAKANSAQVAFNDVGFILGADYEPKNLLTREQVIAMQQEELKKIKSEGTAVMLNYGNDYTLPYVNFITDMNLSGSHYGIVDEMVPFYTMAIHGLVDFSGTSLNLCRDYQNEILKSAESGAGLSFTFINKPTSTLQKSNYTFLFGADYSLWKDKAYEIYSRYNKELGKTFNQYITDHSQLADGVFVTTYEDGTKVYVNYNNIDYVQDGITVPAKDYKVEGR